MEAAPQPETEKDYSKRMPLRRETTLKALLLHRLRNCSGNAICSLTTETFSGAPGGMRGVILRNWRTRRARMGQDKATCSQTVHNRRIIKYAGLKSTGTRSPTKPWPCTLF